MAYSFIRPRPKPILSTFSKIWILFIIFTSVLLISFDVFLVVKTHLYKKNTKKVIHERIALEKKIDNTDDYIEYLLRQKALGEDIHARNIMLKDSMKNLFDLVPDQITLSKVILDKNSLIMYGRTPTKDTFNFLLSAPLKSIFNKSETVFYLTKEGWYNFVSTNSVITEDGMGDE